MITATPDGSGGHLPAELAAKAEETPEEKALRESKERRLLHAREWVAVFGFVAFVLAAAAASAYVAARWAGALRAPGPGLWDAAPVRAAAAAVLSLGGLCVGWGRLVEPHLVRARRLEIATGKLPPGRTLRLAFMSDLHVEGRSRRLGRAARIVAESAPEAILLGGDYANDERERTIEALSSFVGELARTAPVYAVIGNADEPRPSAYQAVAAAGAKVLVNEPVRLAGGVTVWGLRWLDEGALSAAASRLDRTRLNVCLTHAPGMIPGAARGGFDLYLAGHTHGGQVRLPVYGALVTLAVHGKRFERGRYDLASPPRRSRSTQGTTEGPGSLPSVAEPSRRGRRGGGMTAYVTSGVGLEGGWTTRVRFMCPPEVVLIELS